MKPLLSFRQLLSMNVGFFGIQYSFGLQQANMSPIYQYLGADEASLPLLWLAGPVTGLLVQPIVGAMSDRTPSRWGRRTPYFLIGALLCSLCLLAMPHSPALWFAAGLLWILDAANNITMEPYRAYVNDRLQTAQQSQGFLIQSAFTGLAQTLAYLTPSLLFWMGVDKNDLGDNRIPWITTLAFWIGGALSFLTVWFSIRQVPELPLSVTELDRIRSLPRGVRATWHEIRDAVRDMPQAMRDLWWMKLFQWYGMMCYWIYIVPCLAKSVFATTDAQSALFREANLLNGQLGGFYNFVAFLAAFALIPLAKRFAVRKVHALCLSAAALGMLVLPNLHTPALLFIPMLGIGLAWASMMGNPYILLARCIPPERAGVYMGIFNMFIVLPMILQMLTLPLLYRVVLGQDPGQVIQLAGACLLVAALMSLRIRQA